MAMREEVIEKLGRSSDSIFGENSYENSAHKKNYKLLVISENSSEIYMIKKFLPKEEGFIIHDAPTLSMGLKVLNYLSIDLIVVDDKLSNIDGYEVVSKLNQIEISKEIPKIILLTTDYKTDKKESFNADNLDFVKKPLDSVIFRLRAKNLIKNSSKKSDRKSYFRQLSYAKFQEAQSYMQVYQEIFDSSENLLCIYDASRDEIIESNDLFEKFFLNLHALNRILKNPKLARKFVTYMEEINYLNYYHPSEWMSTLIEGKDFNFIVKLQRDYKEYSFNIFVKKIALDHHSYYLLKLSNIYDYLPTKAKQENDAKLTLKEKNFTVFKEDFLKLRELLWYQNIENSEVEKILYQLSTKLSIISDDPSLVVDFSTRKEINIYFFMVELLKKRFSDKQIYLNNKKIDKFIEEEAESILTKLNPQIFQDLIFGLLNNYYGSYFTDTIEHQRLDIELFEEGDHICVEMTMQMQEELASHGSFVDKLFHKQKEDITDDIVESLPKNVKQSLSLLNAEIKKIDSQKETKFIITIAKK